MNKYLFFLGNHPELSLAEIQSLLAFLGIEASYKSVSSDIYQVNTSTTLSSIIDRLGGTIKIAQIINTLKYLDEKEIANTIEKKDKIFGISSYGFSMSNFEILKLSKRIKKYIKTQDRSISFLLPTDNGKISSAQNSKKIGHNGVEIVLMKENDQFIVAKVIQSQNIDRWSYLDFGLPKSDPKKGMLPPKLAQTMINLGLPRIINNHSENNEESKKICHPELDSGSDEVPNQVRHNNIIIYDPFCGTGRVVLQSALNGFIAYGSDIDKQSVDATKTNLEWLSNKFDAKIDKEKVFEFNATEEGFEKNIENKIDSIVTEPYLGKPMKIAPSKEYIKKTFKDLSDTYLSSLKNFKKTIKNNGKIVMVFPKIGDFSLYEQIVDKISALGYHKISNFNYCRSYQIVKREIVVFELDNKVNNG